MSVRPLNRRRNSATFSSALSREGASTAFGSVGRRQSIPRDSSSAIKRAFSAHYVKDLRRRDKELAKGWGQIATPLRVETEGGVQRVNCANTEGIFRIIQSIPSPKAEPFKRWLAQVGYERVKEIEDPELASARARELYEAKGYLFRINKGVKDISDNASVNRYVAPEGRPVPFKNMVFIGDGTTDIPCFRLVKEQGGLSVAVYTPHKKGKGGKTQAAKYLDDGRVHAVVPANYAEGSELDKIIKARIDEVSAKHALGCLLKEVPNKELPRRKSRAGLPTGKDPIRETNE